MSYGPFKCRNVQVIVNDSIITTAILTNLRLRKNAAIEPKYGMRGTHSDRRHRIGNRKLLFTIRRWFKTDTDKALFYSLHKNHTLFDIEQNINAPIEDGTPKGLKITNCIAYIYHKITGSPNDITCEEIIGEGLSCEESENYIAPVPPTPSTATIYGGSNGHAYLLKWNGTDAWSEAAPQLGANTKILSLLKFNNKLYGGAGSNTAILLEYDDAGHWVKKADALAGALSLYSLAEYNGKLYGSTYPYGYLCEWNGVDAWVQKAVISSGYGILCLCVFNNKLYGGGTSLLGRLYEWNDVDTWVVKATRWSTVYNVYALCVFNSKLYGGGYSSANPLMEWNGVNAWTGVGNIGASSGIKSLCVYNNKLYCGSGPNNGRLYEWNGVDTLVQKAAPFSVSDVEINALCVFNNKLYGCTNNGKLLRWNDVDAWVQVAASYGEEVESIAEYT